MRRLLPALLVVVAAAAAVGAAPEKQLHDAAREGDVALIEELLRSGTRLPNAVDLAGETAVHAAVRANQALAITALLADDRVDPNFGEDGISPLHVACLEGQLAAVDALLAGGHGRVNVNARDSNADTPLHVAVEANHLEIIDKLLAFGGVDVAARNEDGNTAADLATEGRVSKGVVARMKAAMGDPEINPEQPDEEVRQTDQ